MAVPRKTLNPHDGYIAAIAAKTLNHGDLYPRTRGSKRSGQATGSRADNEDIGTSDYGDMAGGFGDEIKAHFFSQEGKIS
jgi:hypothetical protein